MKKANNPAHFPRIEKLMLICQGIRRNYDYPFLKSEFTPPRRHFIGPKGIGWFRGFGTYCSTSFSRVSYSRRTPKIATKVRSRSKFSASLSHGSSRTLTSSKHLDFHQERDKSTLLSIAQVVEIPFSPQTSVSLWFLPPLRFRQEKA